VLSAIGEFDVVVAFSSMKRMCGRERDMMEGVWERLSFEHCSS
jgi:hypothetical protein